MVLVWTTSFHAIPYRVIMAAARRARVVAMVHNAIPHESLPLQRALTRWILSRCDRLVTHARSVADEVSELGVHVESVVVPHPPNIQVTAQPLPPDEELRLLFFGFVRPYKGLDIGLDALALLCEQGFTPRLTVVGELWDGGPVAVWERRIEQLGLQDQVVMQPRYVPDDAVDALLAEHHAVLLPYRSARSPGSRRSRSRPAGR